MNRIFILIFALLLLSPAVEAKPKITFIEIGSTSCIPCKKMQPIMKSIEEKYKDQVKVVFHDVNKKKTVVKKYKIRLIPTQVFLDANGKEIHRHEGFYPQEEIEKFLKENGLTPAAEKKND